MKPLAQGGSLEEYREAVTLILNAIAAARRLPDLILHVLKIPFQLRQLGAQTFHQQLVEF